MLHTHSIVIHQSAVFCQIFHVIDVEATDANTSPVVKDVLQQNMPQKATYRSGHFVCVCVHKKMHPGYKQLHKMGLFCVKNMGFFCAFTTPEHFQEPTVLFSRP